MMPVVAVIIRARSDVDRPTVVNGGGRWLVDDWGWLVYYGRGLVNHGLLDDYMLNGGLGVNHGWSWLNDDLLNDRDGLMDHDGSGLINDGRGLDVDGRR